MMSNTSYHVDSVTGSWAADAHRIPSATTILNTKDITKVNQHDRVYTTATSRHSASGSYTLKRSTPPPFVGTLSPRPRAQQRSATNKVMSPLQESLPNGGVDPTVTRPILSSIETFSKSTHDEGISPLHYASNPRATTRVLKHASPLSGAPINAPVTVSDRLPKSNSSTPLVASPIQSARRSATKDITSVEEYLARARQVAASPPVNECTSPRCTTGNPIQCQHPSQVEEAMAAIKAPSHILLNDLHKIVEQELTHAKQRHRVLDAREEQVEKRAKELLLRERMVDEEIVRLSHAISQQEKLVQHMKEERAARLEDRRQRLTPTAEEKAAETANIAQCVLQHQEEVALLKSQLNDTQSLLIQYQSKPVPVTRLPIPTQTNSDWLNVFESEIEQKLNVTWAQTIEKEKAKLVEELTAENQSMQRIVCKLTLDLFMEQESSERLRHTAVFLEALSDVQKSFQRTWSSEVTLLLNNERKVMQSLHQKWEYSREMLHIQQQQLDEQHEEIQRQHEEIQRQHEEIQRQQEEIQRQQGLLNKTPKASTTYQTEEKKGFGEACRALSDDFLDASEEKKEFATEDNLLFNKNLQDDESSEFFPVQMLTLNFEEPPVPCVVLPKSFRPSPSYVETLKEEEEEDSDDDLTDLLNRGSCSQSCSSYGSEARRRLGRRSQKKRTQRRGVAASSRYHLKECFSFEDPEVVHARQYGSRVRGAAAAGEDGPDIIGVEETEASSCVEILAALIDTGVMTEQELMSMLHSGYTPQDIVHLYMSAAQQQSYFLNDSYPSASYGSTAGHEGSTSYEYQNDYDPVTTPGARGELSPSPRMVEEGFCTPDGPRASDTYDPSYEYTGLEESLNREESNYDHVPIMVLPERALRPNPYKTQWESSPSKGRTDSMDHDLSRTEEEMIDDLCSRDGECAPLHGHLNLHDMEKGFSCGLVQGVTERGNSIQSID